MLPKTMKYRFTIIANAKWKNQETCDGITYMCIILSHLTWAEVNTFSFYIINEGCYKEVDGLFLVFLDNFSMVIAWV
jgi:hypothetical protein